MLVLTRKKKEIIRIGPDIVVTILRVHRGNVRIGIDAPNHLTVLRGELEVLDDEFTEDEVDGSV